MTTAGHWRPYLRPGGIAIVQNLDTVAPSRHRTGILPAERERLVRQRCHGGLDRRRSEPKFRDRCPTTADGVTGKALL